MGYHVLGLKMMRLNACDGMTVAYVSSSLPQGSTWISLTCRGLETKYARFESYLEGGFRTLESPEDGINAIYIFMPRSILCDSSFRLCGFRLRWLLDMIPRVNGPSLIIVDAETAGLQRKWSLSRRCRRRENAGASRCLEYHDDIHMPGADVDDGFYSNFLHSIQESLRKR